MGATAWFDQCEGLLRGCARGVWSEIMVWSRKFGDSKSSRSKEDKDGVWREASRYWCTLTQVIQYHSVAMKEARQQLHFFSKTIAVRWATRIGRRIITPNWLNLKLATNRKSTSSCWTNPLIPNLHVPTIEFYERLYIRRYCSSLKESLWILCDVSCLHNLSSLMFTDEKGPSVK